MKNVFFIVTVLVLFGCSGQSDPHDSSRWKTYNTTDFSLKYPETWVADSSGKMGLGILLYINKGLMGGTFQENVNVLVQDLHGFEMSLETYVESSETQIIDGLKNSKMISSERKRINNEDCHQLIYEGDFENMRIKWMQYYWVKHKKAVILTFTARPESYDDYSPFVDEIAKTLMIK